MKTACGSIEYGIMRMGAENIYFPITFLIIVSMEHFMLVAIA